MKQISCVKVYDFFMKRYDHYDKVEGKFCGEKYTKIIQREAAEKFKTTEEEINKLYWQYIETLKMAKANKEDIEKLQLLKKEVKKATKLDGKKVKINLKNIEKNKKRQNPLFINFINNNKNKTFTAITDQQTPTAYTLKEDTTWLFLEDDLIVVE